MTDFIDLDARRAARQSRGGVDLSRGVDLSALRNKNSHKHRWVILASFDFDEKILTKLVEDSEADMNRQIKAADAGEVYESPGVEFQIDLSTERLIGTDGPRCVKCHEIWNSPKGYGQVCAVADQHPSNGGGPGDSGPGPVAV